MASASGCNCVTAGDTFGRPCTAHGFPFVECARVNASDCQEPQAETTGEGSAPYTPWQVHPPIVQTLSAQTCPHVLSPVRKGILQTPSPEAARQDRKRSFVKDFSSRTPDQNASKVHEPGVSPIDLDDVHDVSQEVIIVGYIKSVCSVHRPAGPLLAGTLMRMLSTLGNSGHITRQHQGVDSFDLMRLRKFVTHDLPF
jgi:hypothetical protein